MASSTTNLGLIKPAGNEKIRIAQINQNSDTIDNAIGAVGSTSLQAQVSAIEDGIAIVANGDSHVAITAGQFVYVRNNTHNLADGLYVASANVSANASITSSNMTADASGGLNALNAKINTINTRLGTKTLTSTDDLNTLTGVSNSGNYYITSNVQNAPSGGNWTQLVVIGGSITTQIVYGSARMWIRAYTGNPIAWTEWKEFALKSDLTNLTKDYGAIGGFTAGAKFTVESSRVQIFGTQAYMTVVVTANQAYGNTDVIATIPENYRPIRASTSMLSILNRSSSVLTFTGQDIIETDGTIKEGFTGSNGQVGDKYTIVAIYQVKS